MFKKAHVLIVNAVMNVLGGAQQLPRRSPPQNSAYCHGNIVADLL